MLDIVDALDLLGRCADRDGLGNLMSGRKDPGSDHPIAWTSGLIGSYSAAPAVTVVAALDCSTQRAARVIATRIASGLHRRWPAGAQWTLGAAAVLGAAEREGRRGATWAQCLAAADVATLRFVDLLPDALRRAECAD